MKRLNDKMSDSFSEIYRPKTPKQLVGEVQRQVAQTLLDNVAKGEIIQEILFYGPSGVGKSTIAKMYIGAVLGKPYNLDPYNCGDKTGVQYVREQINATIDFLPLDENYRVYFLEEVHKLTEEAQQNLLITIEPVPDHVLLVACTTDPDKLIKTFRGRFTRIYLPPPNYGDFCKLCKWICTKEGCSIEDKIRDDIINISDGSLREFVKYIQLAMKGIFSYENIEDRPEIELVKLIINGNTDIKKWLQAVDESKDLVRQAMGMVGYSVAVLKNGNNGKSGKAAMAVIEHFGDSPTRTIDGKQTFFNRLMRVYRDLI